jgi:selenocysteine lyase/cysteine desulfurase
MPRKKPISFYYATVAPLSDAAYAAGQEYLEMYRRIGSPEILFEYERRRRTLEGVAREGAKLFNCSSNEITFIPNTTYGMNVASHALPLLAGDEIIVQAAEYKGNYWPWIEKHERDGCAVREISAANNAEGFEKLIAAISPKTKVVAVSWIQYYDGYISDLDRLSRVCRENGALLVVDAVQGIGIRELDLKKIHIDILAAGGQKYVCAGPGGGILYINREIMPMLRDTFVGIRSMHPGPAGEYRLKDGAERFQTGTIDMQAAVQLHAALREINEIGIETIEHKNVELLRTFKKILLENHIPFIDHDDRQSNIIALIVPDPKGLISFLAQDRIYIKQIEDIARISFHHTSTVSDFKKLVKKIREYSVAAPRPLVASIQTAV